MSLISSDPLLHTNHPFPKAPPSPFMLINFSLLYSDSSRNISVWVQSPECRSLEELLLGLTVQGSSAGLLPLLSTNKIYV